MTTSRLFVFAGALSVFVAALAQKPQINDGEAHGDPPYLIEDGWRPLLNGRDLSGWRPQENSKPNEWFTSPYVLFDGRNRPALLAGHAAPGSRIINGPMHTVNLVTDEKFGDMELYLEFLIAKGSNSGVYLHGLYEVQIFDSFGVAALKYSDGGGIYHRWINNQGAGGSPPSQNASRRAGEWQSYHIWFRAPRFADGRKVENARFLRVLYNGVAIQNNVDLEGGTRAHMSLPESATNPLMLQGDHGPVAFRHIYWRPLRAIEGK